MTDVTFYDTETGEIVMRMSVARIATADLNVTPGHAWTHGRHDPETHLIDPATGAPVARKDAP